MDRVSTEEVWADLSDRFLVFIEEDIRPFANILLLIGFEYSLLSDVFSGIGSAFSFQT